MGFEYINKIITEVGETRVKPDTGAKPEYSIFRLPNEGIRFYPDNFFYVIK